MFSNFKYEAIPLKNIILDDRNPRIVTQTKLSTQPEIVKYLFEHEDLDKFIKKIASEGKNVGAERPYVVKDGKKYVVVEGNTRIAAYKILTGLVGVPAQYNSSVIEISQKMKDRLLSVDCSIAPNRDALLPIMGTPILDRAINPNGDIWVVGKLSTMRWCQGKVSLSYPRHLIEQKGK